MDWPEALQKVRSQEALIPSWPEALKKVHSQKAGDKTAPLYLVPDFVGFKLSLLTWKIVLEETLYVRRAQLAT